MGKVLLYDDPIFDRHETGAHPESPQRLQAIRKELAARDLKEQCQSVPTRLASLEELSLVHGTTYIDEVRQASEAGGRRLDPDTVASRDSFDVARRAAGTSIDAVDRVLKGESRRALCLIRPPGHHALANRAMGFCLFSNIAIAAAHARAAHGLDRVLIVDWDVHHGNGTQDIFYADGQVHFLSLHRWPFYPGSGSKDETGTGDGLGATLNVPLEFGITRQTYLAAFRSSLERIADKAKPQLILLSAGFDAHHEDPVGSLSLETEDFIELTKILCETANLHCGGKIVSLLEGGYNVDRLAESVAVHLEGLISYGNE